jgi:hypothetical protein
MPTIIDENGNNLLVSDDNSTGDIIILGNGINDFVSAVSSQYDIVTLGNGAGDSVKRHRQQLRHDHPRQRRQ